MKQQILNSFNFREVLQMLELSPNIPVWRPTETELRQIASDLLDKVIQDQEEMAMNQGFQAFWNEGCLLLQWVGVESSFDREEYITYEEEDGAYPVWRTFDNKVLFYGEVATLTTCCGDEWTGTVLEVRPNAVELKIDGEKETYWLYRNEIINLHLHNENRSEPPPSFTGLASDRRVIKLDEDGYFVWYQIHYPSGVTSRQVFGK